MPLILYDTFTQTSQPFTPLNPHRITMYVCGPTVYDSPHLGHARAAVVFDVLYRLLIAHYGQAAIVYIRNYTDIDDKIIQKALQQGRSANDVAQHYIGEYEQSIKSLACLEPNIKPRVTQTIPEIIAFIAKLITNDAAYASGGDVFFDVSKHASYGKLSKRTIADLEAGHRVEIDANKRNPLDFVLWKAAKSGEPSWPSPWGDGRPGWHIECSVMATQFGAVTIDIHGGGLDLIFPHHENELAQCEAHFHQPFVRYWVHNGFVQINAEKMSKSLKNFYTVDELLAVWPAEVLRYYLLSAHYRTPLEFSFSGLAETTKALQRLYDAFSVADYPVDPLATMTESKHRQIMALETWLASTTEKFVTALEQDLNTAKALGLIFETAREVNRIFTNISTLPSAALTSQKMLQQLRKLVQDRLGLLQTTQAAFIHLWNRQAMLYLNLAESHIEEAIAARQLARQAKDWSAADTARQKLAEQGVLLEDTADGKTIWYIDADIVAQKTA